MAETVNWSEIVADDSVIGMKVERIGDNDVLVAIRTSDAPVGIQAGRRGDEDVIIPLLPRLAVVHEIEPQTIPRQAVEGEN